VHKKGTPVQTKANRPTTAGVKTIRPKTAAEGGKTRKKQSKKKVRPTTAGVSGSNKL